MPGPYDSLLGYIGDPIAQMQNPNSLLGASPVAAGPQQKMSIWDKMQNVVAPAPMGMQGLLTEQDIKNARNQGLLGFGASLLESSGPTTAANRVGFGQAIGRGLNQGMGAYQGAINQQLGRMGAAQQYNMNAMEIKAKQQAQQQEQQMAANRAAIVQKYGQPNLQDPNGTAKWIDTVIPELMQAGDVELVGRLSEIRKSLGNGPAGKVVEPEKIDLGGTVIGRDPVTGKEVYRYDKTAAPRDTGAGAEQRQALQMQRDFQREQQLGDDFNKDTTPYRQVAYKLRGALDAAPQAKAGDPASQINMLYAFVNAMDPQSAVREGEIALAQAATPFWTRARAMLDKYTSGQSVTVPPAMVESMEQLMRRRYEGLEKATNERIKYYSNRGKRWGVQPDSFAPLDPIPPATQSGNPLMKP